MHQQSDSLEDPEPRRRATSGPSAAGAPPSVLPSHRGTESPTYRFTNLVCLALLILFCAGKVLRPPKKKPQFKAVGQALRQYCEKKGIKSPVLFNGTGDSRYAYYATASDLFTPATIDLTELEKCSELFFSFGLSDRTAILLLPMGQKETKDSILANADLARGLKISSVILPYQHDALRLVKKANGAWATSVIWEENFIPPQSEIHGDLSVIHVTSDNKLRIAGSCTLLFELEMPVDQSKLYKLKAKVRLTNGKDVRFHFGFIPFSSAGKRITSRSVNPVGPPSRLSRECKPLDTEIWLRDAGNWQKGSNICIAAQAASDKNELPNFNLSSLGIRSLKCIGNEWRVIMQSPCRVHWPANTTVRQHEASWGGMYALRTRIAVQAEWKEVEGFILGSSKKLLSHNLWWPGTAKANVVCILDTPNDSNVVFEVDWLKIEQAHWYEGEKPF